MSKGDVLNAIYKENLSTYFVLPLLKLNRESFTADTNFRNTYMSRDLRHIYVEVVDYVFFEHRMLANPHFVSVWKYDNHFLVQYFIPAKWRSDLRLFADGKFSKMSGDAKELIIEYSGLQYRVRDESTKIPVTDIRLLALSRSKAVRDVLEEEYNVILSEDDELLPSPTDKVYVDVEKLGSCQVI